MLREKMFNKVVIGVRDISRGKDLENLGAIVTEIKAEKPETVLSAIRDNEVTHIYIIPPASKTRYEDTKSYIDAAGNMDLKCVVMMSVVGCDKVHVQELDEEALQADSATGVEQSDDDRKKRQMGESFKQFADCEAYLKKAIKENWCILRQSFFQQNMLLLAEVIQNRGVIPLPLGDGKFSPVNLKDCAISASAVLQHDSMKDNHKKEIFSITGPHSLDGMTIATIAGKMLGRTMSYQNLSPKEMERILLNVSGLNQYDIDFLMDYFWATRKGLMDIKSKNYKDLTGMEGEKVDEFFRENGDQFRPGQGPLESVSSSWFSSCVVQ